MSLPCVLLRRRKTVQITRYMYLVYNQEQTITLREWPQYIYAYKRIGGILAVLPYRICVIKFVKVNYTRKWYLTFSFLPNCFLPIDFLYALPLYSLSPSFSLATTLVFCFHFLHSFLLSLSLYLFNEHFFLSSPPSFSYLWCFRFLIFPVTSEAL